jgi:hypothetical protein
VLRPAHLAVCYDGDSLNSSVNVQKTILVAMATQPQKDMERRRFLSYLLLGGAATFLTGFNFLSRSVKESGSTREKLIQDFLNLKTTAISRSKFLGRSYLQDHPGEADQKWLETTIADSCPRREAVHDRQNYHDVGAQIRSDFACGRTVDVNGWILSRTEARLYALISLS